MERKMNRTGFGSLGACQLCNYIAPTIQHMIDHFSMVHSDYYAELTRASRGFQSSYNFGSEFTARASMTHSGREYSGMHPFYKPEMSEEKLSPGPTVMTNDLKSENFFQTSPCLSSSSRKQFSPLPSTSSECNRHEITYQKASSQEEFKHSKFSSPQQKSLEFKKFRAQENLDSVKQEVKTTFDVLIDELKSREKELIEQAESVLKEQMKLIELQEQGFYENLKELEKLCKAEKNHAQNSTGSASPNDKVQPIKKKLLEIEKKANDINNSSINSMTFETENLSDDIANFGSIVVGSTDIDASVANHEVVKVSGKAKPEIQSQKHVKKQKAVNRHDLSDQIEQQDKGESDRDSIIVISSEEDESDTESQVYDYEQFKLDQKQSSLE